MASNSSSYQFVISICQHICCHEFGAYVVTEVNKFQSISIPYEDYPIATLILLKRTMVVEEILTIDIKPGWKKGTKITFPEKGNEAPHVIPADIVFVIDEKPHDLFTREGNDLVMTQKISLAEALTECTVHVTTLDGRHLTIPINTVISPGYEEVVPREGMPIPKDPSKKGNLRIKFSIKFPSRLTSEQKVEIKKLLGS
ncbi:hypothetical protein ACP70R_015574 [Stipagrostis hirtigluma subsp. patula]